LKLAETARYTEFGLDEAAQTQLALLGDVILGAGFNVTRVNDPDLVERFHFLDSLSLLELPCVTGAHSIVDVGSGAGLPALVLAIALPATIVAVESQRKKCVFIEQAAAALKLENVVVRCARAEEYGRMEGRGQHDIAVSRALAALPVVAEYSMPLLALGGHMVSMKGAISDQERIQAEKAVGILGGDSLEAVKLQPFPDAQNRWVYTARKIRLTPRDYPRRSGIPAKRPLGA
jgi:16S rRNA (guanine527-N7)-methyltransferase